MKKYKLDYNKALHRETIQKQNAKKQELANMLNLLKKIGIDIVDMDKFQRMPLTEVQRIYMDKNKDVNVSGKITFNKLATLLDDDFTEFIMSVGRYESNTAELDREYTEEDFSMFTETEAQNKRYNDVKNIIDSIVLSDHFKGNTSTISRIFSTQPFAKIIQMDSGNPKPRPQYIITGK
jgi:hypothetical protein